MSETASQVSDFGKPPANEKDINPAKAWKYFGQYISKKMQVPSSIYIPKFGQFTFTGGKPNFKLKRIVKDNTLGFPIFIIANDFIKGLKL